MRSRYSAYVLDDADYLSQTWHRDYRPRKLTIDPGIHYIGLTIIASDQRDAQATVEFEARLLVDGRVEALHEKSRFVRARGRWLYTDGDALAPSFTPWKPARNQDCPCGSGKKFKRCCGGA